MVLNVSEMEAKVREATNDDPWYVISKIREVAIWVLSVDCRGASSTLMTEIAQGYVPVVTGSDV